VPRSVLVIREVEQLARRAKWRACDLAEALGVSLSMLNRLRAGSHAPSREVLGAILRSFGTNAHVRDLILHFLEHELPLALAGRLDATPRGVRDSTDVLRTLDPKTRAEVRAFVTHFLRRSLTSGKGLHVVGDDVSVLHKVVSYVRTTLDTQGVPSVVLAGNARVSASLRKTALAVPLLIVERAEFASENVRALLDARGAIRKPVLLTSESSRATSVAHPSSSPRVHAAA
jgi:transcriptional regulator with XRE-family HTH domain